MSARSAYALRTVLATAGGPCCVAADGGGATRTAWAATAVFGLLALADLVVIRRRQRTRA